MLPSLPVTTTWLAFVAVTVSMDEAPEMIVAGLAVMPLVGTTGGALKPAPPHPASSIEQGITIKRILLNNQRVSDFVTVSSFPSLTGTCRSGVLCRQMSNYQAVTFHQFTPRSRASGAPSLCGGPD